jgi:hypothetical protein
VLILRQLQYTPQNHYMDPELGVSTCNTAPLPPSPSPLAKVDGASVDGLWLGQYENYIMHLNEDMREAARKAASGSGGPPQESPPVTSSTPTAASAIFKLSLRDTTTIITTETGCHQPDDDQIQVIVSAGKALDSREMFVRVSSQKCMGASEERLSCPCTLTFGIQGGIAKYIQTGSKPSDSGPYIVLEGNCWSRQFSRVHFPDGWSIFPLPVSVPVDSSSLGSAVGREEQADLVGTESKIYIIRPDYLLSRPQLQSSSTRHDSSSSPPSDGISTKPVYSEKYRNNAYIDIFGALFRNDRSYFTTTEVC